MNRKNPWLIYVAALIAAPLAFVACGDDEEVACESNADCELGETCAGGVCRAGCLDSDDCATGVCANDCLDTPFCYEPCSSDDDCGGGTCVEFCEGKRQMCQAADETCTSDEECGEGEICDDESETCVRGCREDEDCVEGEVCNPDALGCEVACEDSSECDEDAGETCVDGHCVVGDGSCEEHTDCSDRPAYCEPASGDEESGTCIDLSCGSDVNSCDACTDGPNDGAGDEDGPIIFNPRVECTEDTTACPDAGTFKCSFSFDAFDANEDLAVSDIGDHIHHVAGSEPQSWGLRYDDGTYTFVGGCYGDNNESTKSSTIYLTNESGDASNTLCF